ncbi:MAG: hypothetical protein R3D60_02495 [Paracoccaceae bacterium]
MASAFSAWAYVQQAQAQTAMETAISLTLPLTELRMSSRARSEVESALRAMSDRDLSLTYARIHSTFAPMSATMTCRSRAPWSITRCWPKPNCSPAASSA